MPSVLERLEALSEGATEGPWRVGSPSYKCPRHREPGHVHNTATCEYVLTDWYGHDISASGLVPTKVQGHRNERLGMVAGQWDYGEGGVLHESDAALIAAARNALPDLLAVAKAAAVAIPVSACDYPDGACEHECGRTADDHSGCLRIKALEALAPLLREAE